MSSRQTTTFPSLLRHLPFLAISLLFSHIRRPSVDGAVFWHGVGSAVLGPFGMNVLNGFSARMVLENLYEELESWTTREERRGYQLPESK